MRPYTEQKKHWCESKALEFFLNFIRNHNGSVNDNDTFALVSGLLTHEQWIERIKQTFSEEMIEKMGQQPRRGDCLDFTDSPQEIIREIWCCEFARKKMRALLSEVASSSKTQILSFVCSNIFPESSMTVMAMPTARNSSKAGTPNL